MVRYVKCPRCELNYIDEETQEYCDVCLAEIHGDRLQFADLDEDDLEELDAELEQADVCPVCGVNPVRFGEKMCDSCKQNSSEYADEEEIDIEQDEVWKNYLDEDDGDLTVDDETLEEELEEEEEEETYNDDFFEEDLEPLDDLDDEDDEDEDLDDEDDDF